MRTTEQSFWRSSGLLSSTVSMLSATAASGWAQVHAQVASQPWLGCSLPEAGGLTLYHHCVARAFGHAADAARAQIWLKQLTAQLYPLPTRSWPVAYLDQACLLAWISADGRAVSPTLLAELDARLGQEALHLLAEASAASRRDFFQILRYFSLRQLAPTARLPLQAIGAAWPGVLAPPPSLLGLVQGTSAELLVCIRLAQAGFVGPQLVHYVREGIRHLLATRHAVDSSQQQYSVFPVERSLPTAPAFFSAELSWRRGDLGQALLLHEAHSLLQDPELARFADLVGLHTLVRTTEPATQVVGASLYRGAAGVAQLYRQLYRLSHRAAYLKGYEFWLGQIQYWLQTEPTILAGRPAESSLRNGLTGVGLVLLSASTETELGWEASLLGAG